MKIFNLFLVGLILLMTQINSVSAEQVFSLRGMVEVDELSEMIPNHRTMAVDGGIDVNYEDQPPLIPHSIDKTRITLDENTCLSCHSKASQKVSKAVRPPRSHYRNRGDNRLSQISTGRYFCTQCHVPQAYTESLVENSFEQ